MPTHRWAFTAHRSDCAYAYLRVRTYTYMYICVCTRYVQTKKVTFEISWLTFTRFSHFYTLHRGDAVYVKLCADICNSQKNFREIHFFLCPWIQNHFLKSKNGPKVICPSFRRVFLRSRFRSQFVRYFDTDRIQYIDVFWPKDECQ